MAIIKSFSAPLTAYGYISVTAEIRDTRNATKNDSDVSRVILESSSGFTTIKLTRTNIDKLVRGIGSHLEMEYFDVNWQPLKLNPKTYPSFNATDQESVEYFLDLNIPANMPTAVNVYQLLEEMAVNGLLSYLFDLHIIFFNTPYGTTANPTTASLVVTPETGVIGKIVDFPAQYDADTNELISPEISHQGFIGNGDGSVTGTLVDHAGNYVFMLLSPNAERPMVPQPSEVLTAPQASPVFSGLTAGEYYFYALPDSQSYPYFGKFTIAEAEV